MKLMREHFLYKVLEEEGVTVAMTCSLCEVGALSFPTQLPHN